MKISAIRPGMRLRSTYRPRELATVTALTDGWFMYDADEDQYVMPGVTAFAKGRQHFGSNGETFFELTSDPVVEDDGPVYETVRAVRGGR